MNTVNLENEINQLSFSVRDMKIQMESLRDSLERIQRDLNYIIPKVSGIESLHEDVKELVMAQHVKDALEKEKMRWI